VQPVKQLVYMIPKFLEIQRCCISRVSYSVQK